MAFRTVPREFTMNDVVHTFLPADVVKLCRDAYPVVRGVDRGGGFDMTMALPIMAAGMLDCNLHIMCSAEKNPMLCPVPDLARVSDGFENNPIRHAIAGCYTVHLQFEKMRRVCEWAADNLSAAAARDYVPWMGGILARDSAFHNFEAGAVYKEPARSPDAELLGYMRECNSLMATALLCPAIITEEDTETCNFSVSFDKGSTNSELFWLL